MKTYSDCTKCTEESVIDVVCDVCGKSCKRELAPDVIDFYYATLTAVWGYGSQHDGEVYVSDICEDCFFKIKTEHNIKSI